MPRSPPPAPPESYPYGREPHPQTCRERVRSACALAHRSTRPAPRGRAREPCAGCCLRVNIEHSVLFGACQWCRQDLRSSWKLPVCSYYTVTYRIGGDTRYRALSNTLRVSLKSLSQHTNSSFNEVTVLAQPQRTSFHWTLPEAEHIVGHRCALDSRAKIYASKSNGRRNPS